MTCDEQGDSIKEMLLEKLVGASVLIVVHCIVAR
jgi:hypothetical protein